MIDRSVNVATFYISPFTPYSTSISSFASVVDSSQENHDDTFNILGYQVARRIRQASSRRSDLSETSTVQVIYLAAAQHSTTKPTEPTSNSLTLDCCCEWCDCRVRGTIGRHRRCNARNHDEKFDCISSRHM
jgi:hypothetical protein